MSVSHDLSSVPVSFHTLAELRRNWPISGHRSIGQEALRFGEPLVQAGSQVGVPACDLVQILTAVQAAVKLLAVNLPPGLLLQDYQIRPDDLHHGPRGGPGMPVRDRYGRLIGEQRYLDAGVISPGELDVSLGDDALQLRVMCLEMVGDLFQPGPGRWAERTCPPVPRSAARWHPVARATIALDGGASGGSSSSFPADLTVGI